MYKKERRGTSLSFLVVAAAVAVTPPLRSVKGGDFHGPTTDSLHALQRSGGARRLPPLRARARSRCAAPLRSLRRRDVFLGDRMRRMRGPASPPQGALTRRG